MSPVLHREPLVVRAALTAAVTALLHVAVVKGWLSVESASEDAVAGVVDGIGLAVAVLWSRNAVTPVADPVIETTTATRLNDVQSTVAATVVTKETTNVPDLPGNHGEGWEDRLAQAQSHSHH